MTGKEPSIEQQKNMSVRLDADTKELLALVADALGVKEKDVAIKAIQIYCSDKLGLVIEKLEALRLRYKKKASE